MIGLIWHVCFITNTLRTPRVDPATTISSSTNGPKEEEKEKTKPCCSRELWSHNWFNFTHHWSFVREASETKRYATLHRSPCSIGDGERRRCSAFWSPLPPVWLHVAALASGLVTRRVSSSGYIHRPRRRVVGLGPRPLAGEARHSASLPARPTCSEAWGSGPGCGWLVAS